MNGKIEETEYTDYDNPAQFGFYKKTIKKPYTEIQLWDGRKFKVQESINNIKEFEKVYGI